MDKIECFSEKISARTLGVLLIPLALAFAFIGGLIIPVIGLLFALPLLIASGALLFAPDSKACRLIAETAKKAVTKT